MGGGVPEIFLYIRPWKNEIIQMGDGSFSRTHRSVSVFFRSKKKNKFNNPLLLDERAEMITKEMEEEDSRRIERERNETRNQIPSFSFFFLELELVCTNKQSFCFSISAEFGRISVGFCFSLGEVIVIEKKTNDNGKKNRRLEVGENSPGATFTQ